MFALVVPGAALAIGSLLPAVLIAVTLAAAASTVLLWLEAPRRGSRAGRWVLAAFAILLGATALQAIPLPAALVSSLAPGNADVWARALSPLREGGPGWHPISVARTATNVEVLRGVLYACVFLSALRITLSEGGVRFLESVVVASACTLALSTLAHASVHAERVFGAYQPRDAQGYVSGRIGPLLNPNHVAAYCNVGALTAAGVAVGDRRVMPRALAAAAAVLLAFTSVWAGSRGGTASLVIGALLVTGLALHRKRQRHTVGQVEIVIVVIALVGAGALVGMSASEVARGDLAGRDMAKLDIVRSAFRLVPVSPIFGVGRGAFESMFPLVRQGTTYFTFLRAENILAQWVVEWGIPVSIGAAGALFFALRPSVLLRADRPPIGAWTAVIVAVLHDLVDFHLEVPGVTVLVAVCIAVVVGARRASQERKREKRGAGVERIVAFASVGAAALAALIVAPDVTHTLSDDRDLVARWAVDPAVSREDFHRTLRAAMLRHPAEPFLPLAGAVHAQARGGESVVPWIARSLERYPRFGRAHLVLARSLAMRNRAQARLEYRLAYEYDANVRASVLREVPLVIDDEASALELVADGDGGVEMLENLSSALAIRLPATADRLDQELARRDPSAPGPLRRRALAALADLANDHPWCSDRAKCAADGIASAEALARLQPESCEPRVLRARLEIAMGRTAHALDSLSEALDAVRERAACVRQLVTLCLEAGDRRRADAALERATRAGCGSRDDCLDLYTWAARTEEGRGNTVRAITFHKRAAELTPETDEHLSKIAELAEHAGLTSEALGAYGKLAMRHPEDPNWRRRADELRDASMKRLQAPPR